LPADTTIDLGSTAVTPGTGKGVAQVHSFLASAPTSQLPSEIGTRTVSVCDVGDPVCDYDPDTMTDALSPAALAIHTSYAPATSGLHAWVNPLYDVVMNAAAPVPAPPPAQAVQASGVALSVH
jgi:cutinase